MRLSDFQLGSLRLSSLRLRLAAGAGLTILAALTLSGVFLNLLFERYVERRVHAELSVHVKQLAAVLEITGPDRAGLLAPLADPRFQRPLSGLYWQVESENGVILRSRSLFQQSLELQPFSAVAATTKTETVGPDGEALLAVSRVVFVQAVDGSDKALRLTAALDQEDILGTQRAFAQELFVAFALLALALLIAASAQILVGLSPLRVLQEKVRAIRAGEEARMTGDFPSEVLLLVDELNALLDANDKVVNRARDGAADLAHGLKTPLAVLLAESRKLSEEGREDAAAEIAEQVDAMRDRVERHLAVVRMRGRSGGPAGRTDLTAGFSKLIRAMRVMPRGEMIDWRVDAPEGATAPIDGQDFFEVFGNLLDNARKWAESAVEITIERQEARWRISVADDGPGVPEQAIKQILSRGGRLDEQRTGAGLGLAIAVRVVQAYGGRLDIANRPDGGTIVTVFFPA